MKPIFYIDRLTDKVEEEKVYGANAIKLIYGDDGISKAFGAPLLHLLAKTSLFAALYGWWQKLPITKKKIQPFIDAFQVDSAEFAEKPSDFRSFNDFFIRRLKPEARPIDSVDNVAVIPADARYYFYQKADQCQVFSIKGRDFNLSALLGDEVLADKYAKGAMVIARLCPSDYHRFHFPCSGTPSKSRLINGWLYSVNPTALKKDPMIFSKNKRMLCEFETEKFGKVLLMEVGATCVGSIHQTYQPGQKCVKGDEKGYFSFGGSALVILFPPKTIQFDPDLIAATQRGLEIRCLLGQSMGKIIKR